MYKEHRGLLTSDSLYPEEKSYFEAILRQEGSETMVQTALKKLTEYLCRHHGVKPIILIDEYDTPIQAAYINGYYQEMIAFMREFLGGGLKNNLYLHKAVLTGILRVAKESLFSGLNNLEVYSILRKEYGEYFGFTEAEVDDLFEQAGLSEKERKLAQEWYNGYQVGETVIYNPWSMVHCLKRKGIFEPYWVHTSDNALIKEMLLKSTLSIKKKLTALLRNEPIQEIMDEAFVYPDLDNSETAFWSLFLMSGYLKVISVGGDYEQGMNCQLLIPNREIRSLYRQIIERWLSDREDVLWYNAFLAHLLTGEISAFEEKLTQVILQIASFHDLAHSPEAFYAGLLLGLSASLNACEYLLYSNRESGLGCYDLAIIPKNPQKLGILMEFKCTELPKALNKQAAALQKSAVDALKQMETHQYSAQFKQHGIQSVCHIGIAFSGKQLKVAHVMRETNG